MTSRSSAASTCIEGRLPSLRLGKCGAPGSPREVRRSGSGLDADPAELELLDLLSDINCPICALVLRLLDADCLRSLEPSPGNEGSAASIGDTYSPLPNTGLE